MSDEAQIENIVVGDKKMLFDSALLVACAETGGDLAALRENLASEGVSDRDALVGCSVVIRDRWANLIGAMKANKPLPMFCHREIKRWEPMVLAFPGLNGADDELAEWVAASVERAIDTRRALHRKSKADIRELPQRSRAKAQLAVSRWGKLMALEGEA